MASEHPAVTKLREYLRIRSVHPKPDYGECQRFLEDLGSEAGFNVEVVCPAGKPVILISKIGTDPSLPSILLNSHTDVVPVFEDKWKSDPFAADKDEQGNIYARGIQDMKGVGIMHFAALQSLKDVKLRRTVHLSFVPDEEIGGEYGMQEWVKTDHFKRLNVGFSLDESVCCPLKQFVVFCNERIHSTIKFTATGNSGHGSMFVEDTAGEKLSKVLASAFAYRAAEAAKPSPNPFNFAANATTMNLTILSGGVQANVLPESLEAIFDCRIAPSVEIEEFKAMLQEWCDKAGKGVSYEFLQLDPKTPTTPTDSSNPYFVAMKAAMDKLNHEMMIITCPGTTDSRYLRQVGVSAIGLTGINETPILLHDHNEFVNEAKIVQGIEIFTEIIKNVASLE